MKPHSSYKETLEEQQRLKPTITAQTVIKPAIQLNLPAPKQQSYSPPYTVQPKLDISKMPPNCNRWISPLPFDPRTSSDVDFYKEIQIKLSEIDPILKVETFGDDEMRSYLREEHEREAIREIQANCSHHSVRHGTMRISGRWFVGDICTDCDLMVNPFPSYNGAARDSLRSS